MKILQPNTVFAGRYLLIEKIGVGGFSEVWKAQDQMTEDTLVAIKIYAPERGMDDIGLKQFRREYSLVLNISHSSLLTARHFDIWEGSPYLVLPFCEKGSVYRKVVEEGPWCEREIVRLLADVAGGLAYLHENGILHQDIKPENILIGDRNQYMLTDFGISGRLRSTLRRSTNTQKALTMAYAAPELFGAHPKSTTKCDVFSLGVLIWELAVGEAPWMGAGGAVLRADSVLPELPPEFSRELNTLMHRSMNFAPEHRPEASEIRDSAYQYLQTGHWRVKKAGTAQKPPETSTTEAAGHPTRRTELKVEMEKENVHEKKEASPASTKRERLWLWPVLLVVVLVAGWLGWQSLGGSGKGNRANHEADNPSEQMAGRDAISDTASSILNQSPTAARSTEATGPAQPADRDGDGIADADDTCPDQANANQADFDGDGQGDACDPDDDNDGVADSSDRCPRKAGSSSASGCPDRDGDGIADADDRCPDVAGIAAENGCPRCAYCPEMVFVQGGTFQMGSTDGDSDEQPVHTVRVNDFYIGKYEVTQAQWRAVMGADPPELKFKGCDNCPVDRVSWNDVQTFIRKLNEKTGKRYRLPTEAEWEYAARGGNKSRGYKYAGSNDPDEVAWYWSNSGSKTHPVGRKKPNELGLCDMSGNVWEWCQDWYDSDYYIYSPEDNPKGPPSGDYRVCRGGSWFVDPGLCRAAIRHRGMPNLQSDHLGFRLAQD